MPWARDSTGWRWALGLTLLAFAAYQAGHLHVFERDYDEGVYLAEAHLVTAGFALYHQVKSASPPVFIWMISAVFAVLGSPSVTAVRLVFILASVVGLLALACAARRLAPPEHRNAAAVLAPLLLASSPLLISYGQLAMADVPSLSFSLGALALGIVGWERGRPWFFVGGLGAGMALGVKVLAAYTAPLLALVVLLGYGGGRPFRPSRFVLDGLATLGGFLVPVLVVLSLVPVATAYETAFRFPWEAGRRLADPAATVSSFLFFYDAHLGWAVLGLIGLGCLAVRRAWRALLLLVGWEALVVMLLAQHAPIWRHLLLPLVPPMAVAGAIAMAEGLEGIVRRRLAAVLVVGLALALFAVRLPRAVEFGWIAAPTGSERWPTEVVPWLEGRVSPGELVLADDPMLAVRAGRLVVPSMTDTSFTRIRAGFLRAPDLIAAGERHRPAAIIFWSNRFHALPEWQRWVEANYVVGRRYSPTQVIYVRPSPPAEQSLDASHRFR